MIARHLIIHGQVQGVGYRYAMEAAAERLRVNGWVRNRSDATVEAHIEGDESLVIALIEWAHQGPRGAQVQHVRVTEIEIHGFTTFSRYPTV